MAHQVENAVDDEQRQLPVQRLILFRRLSPGLRKGYDHLAQRRWAAVKSWKGESRLVSWLNIKVWRQLRFPQPMAGMIGGADSL